ncbi:MAG: hypothetical protein ACM3ZF_06725, partial [Mycobacterium leprae]
MSDGEGVLMYARVTMFEGESARDIQRDLSYFEHELLPKTKEIPGMAGGLVLVERGTGQVMTVTLWEDERALEESRDTYSTLYSVAYQTMNLSAAPKMREFEVGVAALEHPV